MKLAKKRIILEEQYKETVFEKLKTVNAIAKKAAVDENAVFDNLTPLLCDEGILYQAIGNISGKKGALTSGPPDDPRTVDTVSNKLVNEIINEIKTGTFRFKPVRRIYMDKTGKNVLSDEIREKLLSLHKRGKVTMDEIKELKARPLGILSFKDKVVQEAMRMILNVIYEPEFAGPR